jgi:hypothetical protein
MTTCPWSGYEPATITWCEERICGWVVEPSNAWSNLGYVIVGLLVLATARRRVPLVLIGVASVCIGFGSFAFHATGTRIGELIDVSAMYLLGGLGVMFAARRLFDLSTTGLVLGYLAVVAVSVGLMIALHNNGIVVFALQVTFTVAAEIRLYRSGRAAPSYTDQKWMIACFALAFFIWNLDRSRIACAPTNHLVTGHAAWHVLTAIAVYFFARQQAPLLARA